MKNFIFKILLLIVFLLIIDKSIGIIFQFMQHHSKGGDTGRMEYIVNRMNQDILIFGSSRAIHHYNPQIIEDSLQMSCYNCGKDGHGIIFSYGMYRLFKDRYVPKAIIYDVIDIFDLINEDNNEKYLDELRYYYNKPGIDSIFINVDKNEKYKMISQMRRYNYKFIQVASDYISPKQQDIKGYRPLEGTIKYKPIKNNNSNKSIQYDNFKLEYFKLFIKDCKEKGTKLIFMVSPQYKGEKKQSYEAIIQLAKEENIPFFDHYNDNEISSNKKYFKDSMHLNKYGAEKYTKKIINEIKSYLK